ncbi:MAG: ABC transporter permease subunit, partial [Planctomycetota bacterium]
RGSGRPMFEFLGWLQMAGAWLFLPAMAGATIAAERERGMLDLLLLTGLSPREIVLQKFAGVLVPTGTLLLLSLPLLAIAYAYGGLSPDLLAAGAGVVVLACLQTIALAILVSAWLRTSAMATVSAYGLLALFAVYPPLIAAAFWDRRQAQKHFSLNAAFLVLTGFFGLGWWLPPVLFLRAQKGGIESVAVASIPCLALAGVLLWAAGRLAGVLYADRPPPPSPALVARKDPFLLLGIRRVLLRFFFVRETGDLPDEEPLAWRTNRQVLYAVGAGFPKIVFGLFWAIALVGFFLAATAFSSGDFEIFRDVIPVLEDGIWGLLVLSACALGASAVPSERQQQTLDVLLSTPISGREFVRRKMGALFSVLNVFRIPFFVVAAMGAVAAGRADSGATHALAAIGAWLAYFPLLPWFAFWIGGRFRAPGRAVSCAIVALLAWLVLPFACDEGLEFLRVDGAVHDRFLWATSPVALLHVMGTFRGEAVWGPWALVNFSLHILIRFSIRRRCLSRAEDAAPTGE